MAQQADRERVNERCREWLASHPSPSDPFWTSVSGRLNIAPERVRDVVQDVANNKDVALDAELTLLYQRLTETQEQIAMLRRSLHASQFGQTFWQQAVESKYLATERLEWGPTYLAALKKADCYAWASFASSACLSASASIPCDSQLHREMTPQSSSGWWWFESPLKVSGIKTDIQRPVRAILWDWQISSDDSRLGLKFMAMSEDVLHGVPTYMPKLCWEWLEGMSFHEMLSADRGLDGVIDKDDAQRPATAEENSQRLKGVAELSMFFLAGCAWLRQRVVVEESAHIERHRRKQLVREYGLSAPPSVRVIQLRRSERKHHDENESPEAAEARHYSCRWVVSGHWRNQPFGIGHSQRRLIFISPYVKGPDNQPLKASVPERVYAVTR